MFFNLPRWVRYLWDSPLPVCVHLYQQTRAFITLGMEEFVRKIGTVPKVTIKEHSGIDSSKTLVDSYDTLRFWHGLCACIYVSGLREKLFALFVHVCKFDSHHCAEFRSGCFLFFYLMSI